LTFIFFNLMLKDSSAQINADSIINRHKKYILANENINDIASTLKTFNSTTQQWPDLNYNDPSAAGWDPISHLNRVYDLALSWAKPSSKYYHQADLLEIINAALNNWYIHKYKCTNWWYNEIGVPQAILNTIVLVRESWTPEQLKSAYGILSQYKVNGTGANLSWSASLALYHGLLTHNDELIAKTSALIQNEVHISTAEGIQPDYSFHQHGSRLQTSQYGEAFIIDNIRLAWELKGSKWAYAQQKINIIIGTVLNGVQWMTRGINNPPGTLDRSVSRKGSLKRTAYLQMIPYLRDLSPENKAKINLFNDGLKGKYNLNGFKYFPYSDFAAYQQTGFSFFLKTISSRSLATELMNGENLKGKLLSSGDTYLIANGNEYFNLMPFWKWDHLPGVTAFLGAEKISQKAFNGSVTNGLIGFSAMDYQMISKIPENTVSAKKMWASYSNVGVCLIADLKSTVPVYTTLDQSRLQGKVTVNQVTYQLKNGTHYLKNVKWIHHSNFGYIPLQKNNIELFTGKVSGSWSTINKSHADSIINDQVFMPILKHDQSLSATGYVLTNTATPQATQALANHPFWKILRNDSTCQAILFKGKTAMITVYKPLIITYNHNEIKFNRSCLILLENGKIFASDPEHKGGTLRLTINNKIYLVDLPIDGTTSKPTTINL
jgi:chondroitin AC lyase